MKCVQIGDCRLIHGDVLESLATLPAGSVHCCVTSPPYWGLRDYGVEGQIGLEPTPEAFIAKMVAVFAEVKRVLRDDGVLFLNLGDSYSSQPQSLDTSSRRYRIREDLSTEEIANVGLEVFGLRFDEYEATRQGFVSSVLPQAIYQGQDASGPSVQGERVAGIIHSQQRSEDGLDSGESPEIEMGMYPQTGRQMPVLRRGIAGVSEHRPHKRGWRTAQEKSNGQEPGKLDQGVPGYTAAGISEIEISSPLLQLQLRNRMLGILSSLEVSGRSIPPSHLACFQPVTPLKPKDLCGMPWRVALALQADGWYWRSTIVWAKKSPMPESVTDRPTSSWEPIFLMAKSERYFYDAEAVREAGTFDAGARRRAFTSPRAAAMGREPSGNEKDGWVTESGFRNQRNVWTLGPEPYSEAHFATFPTEIPRRAIKAGTSEKGCCPTCGAPWRRVVERGETKKRKDYGGPDDGPRDAGIWSGRCGDAETRTVGWERTCEHDGEPVPCVVLDPFLGSGTSVAVAVELGRVGVGVELNGEYLKLACKRIEDAYEPRSNPLFGDVAPKARQLVLG